MDAYVGVLQALQDARDRDQHHVLRRLHADAQRDHAHVNVAQKIVEHVVAVVAPQVHVLLAVVQAMQRPPPVELVRGAVVPVIEKVQHHEVHQERPERTDVGYQRLEVERLEALEAQHAGQRVQQRIEREEDQHREQADAVQHGVDKVVPARARVGKLVHRDQGFHRPQHQEQQQQFEHADHQPLGALERFLDVFAKAELKYQRLDHRFEQPPLGGAEPVRNCLHHRDLNSEE